MSPPAAFDVKRFQALLRTGRLGRRLEYKETVGSSNDRALQLAREGAAHGLLVLADEQLAARGRHGRAWRCAARLGLWGSLVLRPARPAEEHAQLPLALGLSLCEALSRDLGVRGVSLRWPNDIDLNGRKVCGILCEAGGTPGDPAVIAGFGINVYAGAAPGELRQQATSLQEEGWDVAREELLGACLARIEARLAQWEGGGFSSLRQDYLGRMSLVGTKVKVQVAGADVVGRVETVSDAGALVLQTGEGEREFHAGTVERVR